VVKIQKEREMVPEGGTVKRRRGTCAGEVVRNCESVSASERQDKEQMPRETGTRQGRTPPTGDPHRGEDTAEDPPPGGGPHRGPTQNIHRQRIPEGSEKISQYRRGARSRRRRTRRGKCEYIYLYIYIYLYL